MIRIMPLLLALSVATMTHAVASEQKLEQRDAVLEVVNTLFDAMRDKDASGLRGVFTEGATISDISVDSFVQSVMNSRAHLDEVTFDEQVLIDGDLAMAWTPYAIFVDQKFHHCGVDLFIIKRIDDEWKIHRLEDTRRTDNCERRPGPSVIPQ